MASACIISHSHSHDTFPNPNPNPNPPSSDQNQDQAPTPDFEFSLHHPVAMLTADELFSDGKLVPLHLNSSSSRSDPPPPAATTLRSELIASDSPKAPKCSSRWRDLLGLKKLKSPNPDPNPSRSPLKNLLARNPRSPPIETSQSLPLLRDSDTDSLSLSSSASSSSRLSLSSDSSSDLPRLSLDSDKPRRGPIRARPRPARRQHAADAESPRMNSSGKVVFYSGSLERSSSSPSSFNGGGTTRARARGMERSYSANVVRVSPVLNVPVCSLRGSNKGSVFGFFSQRKDKEKEKESAKNNASSKTIKS